MYETMTKILSTQELGRVMSETMTRTGSTKGATHMRAGERG